MDLEKKRITKLPQEVLDAQWAVDSAVIRGKPKSEIDELRQKRDEVRAKYGISE